MLQNLQTCGMCGDNDGESMNDFRVFTKETVTSASKLANAWKVNLLSFERRVLKKELKTCFVGDW